MTKTCRICNKEKTKDSFSKHHTNKDKLSWMCKECTNKYYNKRRIKKGRSKHLDYKTNTYEYNRDAHLLLTYGISLKEYNVILDKQDHCCAICGSHESLFKKKLYVDHDHNTNVIRGLLCESCNHGLGKFKDNTVILENAINYLKNTNIYA
jgi:uncharacterized protein YlaI